MAREALIDYQKAIAAGGEPVYPQWADDLLDVCQQAEARLQFFDLDNSRSGQSPVKLHS